MVRALSPRARAVTLTAAVVVKVALEVNDKFGSAVNVAPVVFRLPLSTRVLPVKSRVPPVGVPFKVMLPAVLVI